MAASQPDLRASAQALLDNPDFHSAIIEQAKILGMDPAKDKKYLHLAAESLVVGSGQHWTKLWDEQNHHEYWHNHTTVRLAAMRMGTAVSSVAIRAEPVCRPFGQRTLFACCATTFAGRERLAAPRRRGIQSQIRCSTAAVGSCC